MTINLVLTRHEADALKIVLQKCYAGVPVEDEAVKNTARDLHTVLTLK